MESGDGQHGRLGHGNEDDLGATAGSMSNVMVDLGNFNAESVAVGWGFSCALSAFHDVKCWGQSQYGQIGMGSTESIGDEDGEMSDMLLAVDLGSGYNAAVIKCGTFHCCTLSTLSLIKCWGVPKICPHHFENF